LFKQLLEADPKDFVAWTELGSLHFSKNKFGDAEKAYGEALALKPDFGPTLLNLGKLFLVQKKLDQAVETLAKAVAVLPNSADVNQCLGEAYLQNKKGSKAVGYLNRAIELAPVEKAEIHLRLAALYNAANLKDRAVAEYKLFLVKVPNYRDKSTLEKYIKENAPK
jgi:tetratricopeptide (TPR) repeat protein